MCGQLLAKLELIKARCHGYNCRKGFGNVLEHMRFGVPLPLKMGRRISGYGFKTK